MARELKALLSQLEEWQMAGPEADLLEDLEEAKEVDRRSKFLRLAAAMGGLKKNYFFVGKARSKGTPSDAMERKAFQQLASRATYIVALLLAGSGTSATSLGEWA